MEDMQAIVERLKEKYGATIHSSNTEKEYKCQKCHDSGWIEHTGEDGYLYVTKCSCRLAREAEMRLANSGLADAIQRQTFDAFTCTTPLQEKIKNTATRYLNALLTAEKGERMPWLYVGGNPGSGKTHICTAVCGELLKHNIGVKYMQWLDEARKLKAGVNDENFEDSVSGYISVSVLYIDDLLKQKYSTSPTFTEADIKIAFTILNARYIMNKPTIISSEWSLLDHLLPADEGVFSRVYERCKGYTVDIDRNPVNNFRLRRETA